MVYMFTPQITQYVTFFWVFTVFSHNTNESHIFSGSVYRYKSLYITYTLPKGRQHHHFSVHIFSTEHLAVARCPSVCHTPVLFLNGYIHILVAPPY